MVKNMKKSATLNICKQPYKHGYQHFVQHCGKQLIPLAGQVARSRDSDAPSDRHRRANSPDMAHQFVLELATPTTRELLPDVILMDVKKPVMEGAESTSRILAEMPGMNILALSIYDERIHDEHDAHRRTGMIS